MVSISKEKHKGSSAAVGIVPITTFNNKQQKSVLKNTTVTFHLILVSNVGSQTVALFMINYRHNQCIMFFKV